MKDIKLEILIDKVEELQKMQNQLQSHYGEVTNVIGQVQSIRKRSDIAFNKKMKLLEQTQFKVDSQNFEKEKRKLIEFMKSYEAPKAEVPQWIYIVTSGFFVVSLLSILYGNLMNKKFQKLKRQPVVSTQVNGDFLDYMKIMKRQAPKTHQLMVDYSDELKKMDRSLDK